MRSSVAHWLLAGSIALGTPLAHAGDTAMPVKLDRAQITGKAFDNPATVVKEEQSERGSFTTHDLEAFLGSDRKFEAGMYKAGPNRYTIAEPYGVDEFMYFLEGGVKLTSQDGSVVEVQAGEAVIIPRDWRGVWDTDGYTKIYVIYSADHPIE
jgi:uncharacterized cupin superfamily protein